MKTRFCIIFALVFFFSLLFKQAFCSGRFSPRDMHIKYMSKYYVGFNAGMNFYFGDIVVNKLNKIPIYRRYGLQVSMERKISKSFRLSAGFFTGNIMGEQHNESQNRNFSTSLFIPGIGVMYKFTRLFGKAGLRRGFDTWLHAGVGCLFFNPAGDLKNRAGKTYYYWNDGTIRDMPMNSFDLTQAVTLNRDYNYETDYRKVNIDNVNKYPRTTLVFPVGLSFEKRINDAWSARIGGLYHFTLTDFLDNITANSLGSRKGNKAMDKFLFIYAGLFYNIPVIQKQHTTVEQCAGSKKKKNSVNFKNKKR